MDRSYTAVAVVTLTPAWLRMNRAARQDFTAAHVQPVLARYDGRVAMRYVDVEAFTGRCSEMLIFTTTDPADFAALWDELRDTPLFADGLMRVDDIIIGLDAAWTDAPAPAAA